MDIEKTMQFLMENAAAHDARLANLENLVTRLTEHQVFLQSAVEETQKSLLETQRLVQKMTIDLSNLGEQTDRRIADLTRAIATFIERQSGGQPR